MFALKDVTRRENHLKLLLCLRSLNCRRWKKKPSNNVIPAMLSIFHQHNFYYLLSSCSREGGFYVNGGMKGKYVWRGAWRYISVVRMCSGSGDVNRNLLDRKLITLKVFPHERFNFQVSIKNANPNHFCDKGKFTCPCCPIKIVKHPRHPAERNSANATLRGPAMRFFKPDVTQNCKIFNGFPLSPSSRIFYSLNISRWWFLRLVAGNCLFIRFSLLSHDDYLK